MADELRAAAELWMTYHDERPRSAHAKEHAQAKLLAQNYIAGHPADDGEPVTEEWLRSLRPQDRGLIGLTFLLTPANDGDAIAELCFAPDGPIGDGWTACLVQDSSDHVLLSSLPRSLTRGHVRRLLEALGVKP